MSGFSRPSKEAVSTPTKDVAEELRWVDILAIDGNGNSALMIGVRDNREEVVKFVVEKALSLNKLSEVLQIVNKDDENAYSLALRSENVALLRIIEDATEREKKQSIRRNRRFLKYKSSESFKATPKRIDMHRPKSEEAVGSASTSDVEPEIDDSLEFKKDPTEVHEAIVKSLSELQSPGFEKRPSLTDSEGKPAGAEKTPTIGNLHSDSFTFEHETIDFTTPAPTPGIMNSLGCKFRSLMSGRRDDPTKPRPRTSVTTTQVHFTTMPSFQHDVYDGTAESSITTIRDPQKRLTIAHHHYTDSDGDNSICVPPEFSGPDVAKKLSGDKTSGLTPMSEAIMKPLRNLRSRGQSSEGRARSYKAMVEQEGD